MCTEHLYFAVAYFPTFFHDLFVPKRNPSQPLMSVDNHVDIDLYGRGFDGIFGRGAEQVNKRQALLKLQSTLERRAKAYLGDYIEKDDYGRAHPRIFGPGSHIISQNEAKKHLDKQFKNTKSSLRAIMFPAGKISEAAQSFAGVDYFLDKPPHIETITSDTSIENGPDSSSCRVKRKLPSEEVLPEVEPGLVARAIQTLDSASEDTRTDGQGKTSFSARSHSTQIASRTLSSSSSAVISGVAAVSSSQNSSSGTTSVDTIRGDTIFMYSGSHDLRGTNYSSSMPSPSRSSFSKSSSAHTVVRLVSDTPVDDCYFPVAVPSTQGSRNIPEEASNSANSFDYTESATHSTTLETDTTTTFSPVELVPVSNSSSVLISSSASSPSPTSVRTHNSTSGRYSEHISPTRSVSIDGSASPSVSSSVPISTSVPLPASMSNSMSAGSSETKSRSQSVSSNDTKVIANLKILFEMDDNDLTKSGTVGRVLSSSEKLPLSSKFSNSRNVPEKKYTLVEGNSGSGDIETSISTMIVQEQPALQESPTSGGSEKFLYFRNMFEAGNVSNAILEPSDENRSSRSRDQSPVHKNVSSYSTSSENKVDMTRFGSSSEEGDDVNDTLSVSNVISKTSGVQVSGGSSSQDFEALVASPSTSKSFTKSCMEEDINISKMDANMVAVDTSEEEGRKSNFSEEFHSGEHTVKTKVEDFEEKYKMSNQIGKLSCEDDVFAAKEPLRVTASLKSAETEEISKKLSDRMESIIEADGEREELCNVSNVVAAFALNTPKKEYSRSSTSAETPMEEDIILHTLVNYSSSLPSNSKQLNSTSSDEAKDEEICEKLWGRTPSGIESGQIRNKESREGTGTGASKKMFHTESKGPNIVDQGFSTTLKEENFKVHPSAGTMKSSTSVEDQDKNMKASDSHDVIENSSNEALEDEHSGILSKEEMKPLRIQGSGSQEYLTNTLSQKSSRNPNVTIETASKALEVKSGTKGISSKEWNTSMEGFHSQKDERREVSDNSVLYQSDSSESNIVTALASSFEDEIIDSNDMDDADSFYSSNFNGNASTPIEEDSYDTSDIIDSDNSAAAASSSEIVSSSEMGESGTSGHGGWSSNQESKGTLGDFDRFGSFEAVEVEETPLDSDTDDVFVDSLDHVIH